MSRQPASVVLVGRPNVGKSTLFNRITGSRRAIVAPVAGTTRDSLGRRASWGRLTFDIFDTGGLYGASEDPLHELVVRQGQRAIEGADLLVFLVDGREGLVPGDQTVARELRATGVPILLAVNKTDDKRASASDFYQLGFEPVIEVSAEHGTGVAELLDEIVSRLKSAGFTQRPDEPHEAAATPATLRPQPSAMREAETAVAIVGRPNVGKSSLLNRLLKEERVLVSEMPGTTRDA